ncbi:DsbA family protein [bacterium]|nr:DsbA family protein [bacterium]
MEQVRWIVYSDYLCPWCFNGMVRLRAVEREFEGRVRLEWRSYLLRPEPSTGRDLEKFRAYTRTWLRPAEESDSGSFRVWQGDAGPPSHSIPPHRVAKAARSLGEDAFRSVQEGLFRAYFAENRDISETRTLAQVWEEAGLPPGEFARSDDPRWSAEAVAEHEEAIRLGAGGVPSVRVDGDEACVTGAFPTDMYRRWARRLLGG